MANGTSPDTSTGAPPPPAPEAARDPSEALRPIELTPEEKRQSEEEAARERLRNELRFVSIQRGHPVVGAAGREARIRNFRGQRLNRIPKRAQEQVPRLTAQRDIYDPNRPTDRPQWEALDQQIRELQAQEVVAGRVSTFIEASTAPDDAALYAQTDGFITTEYGNAAAEVAAAQEERARYQSFIRIVNGTPDPANPFEQQIINGTFTVTGASHAVGNAYIQEMRRVLQPQLNQRQGEHESLNQQIQAAQQEQRNVQANLRRLGTERTRLVRERTRLSGQLTTEISREPAMPGAFVPSAAALANPTTLRAEQAAYDSAWRTYEADHRRWEQRIQEMERQVERETQRVEAVEPQIEQANTQDADFTNQINTLNTQHAPIVADEDALNWIINNVGAIPTAAVRARLYRLGSQGLLPQFQERLTQAEARLRQAQANDAAWRETRNLLRGDVEAETQHSLLDEIDEAYNNKDINALTEIVTNLDASSTHTPPEYPPGQRIRMEGVRDPEVIRQRLEQANIIAHERLIDLVRQEAERLRKQIDDKVAELEKTQSANQLIQERIQALREEHRAGTLIPVRARVLEELQNEEVRGRMNLANLRTRLTQVRRAHTALVNEIGRLNARLEEIRLATTKEANVQAATERAQARVEEREFNIEAAREQFRGPIAAFINELRSQEIDLQDQHPIEQLFRQHIEPAVAQDQDFARAMGGNRQDANRIVGDMFRVVYKDIIDQVDRETKRMESEQAARRRDRRGKAGWIIGKGILGGAAFAGLMRGAQHVFGFTLRALPIPGKMLVAGGIGSMVGFMSGMLGYRRRQVAGEFAPQTTENLNRQVSRLRGRVVQGEAPAAQPPVQPQGEGEAPAQEAAQPAAARTHFDRALDNVQTGMESFLIMEKKTRQDLGRIDDELGGAAIPGGNEIRELISLSSQTLLNETQRARRRHLLLDPTNEANITNFVNQRAQQNFATAYGSIRNSPMWVAEINKLRGRDGRLSAEARRQRDTMERSLEVWLRAQMTLKVQEEMGTLVLDRMAQEGRSGPELVMQHAVRRGRVDYPAGSILTLRNTTQNLTNYRNAYGRRLQQELGGAADVEGMHLATSTAVGALGAGAGIGFTAGITSAIRAGLSQAAEGLIHGMGASMWMNAALGYAESVGAHAHAEEFRREHRALDGIVTANQMILRLREMRDTFGEHGTQAQQQQRVADILHLARPADVQGAVAALGEQAYVVLGSPDTTQMDMQKIRLLLAEIYQLRRRQNATRLRETLKATQGTTAEQITALDNVIHEQEHEMGAPAVPGVVTTGAQLYEQRRRIWGATGRHGAARRAIQNAPTPRAMDNWRALWGLVGQAIHDQPGARRRLRNIALNRRNFRDGALRAVGGAIGAGAVSGAFAAWDHWHDDNRDHNPPPPQPPEPPEPPQPHGGEERVREITGSFRETDQPGVEHPHAYDLGADDPDARLINLGQESQNRVQDGIEHATIFRDGEKILEGASYQDRLAYLAKVHQGDTISGTVEIGGKEYPFSHQITAEDNDVPGYKDESTAWGGLKRYAIAENLVKHTGTDLDKLDEALKTAHIKEIHIEHGGGPRDFNPPPVVPDHGGGHQPVAHHETGTNPSHVDITTHTPENTQLSPEQVHNYYEMQLNALIHQNRMDSEDFKVALARTIFTDDKFKATHPDINTNREAQLFSLFVASHRDVLDSLKEAPTLSHGLDTAVQHFESLGGYNNLPSTPDVWEPRHICCGTDGESVLFNILKTPDGKYKFDFNGDGKPEYLSDLKDQLNGVLPSDKQVAFPPDLLSADAVDGSRISIDSAGNIVFQQLAGEDAAVSLSGETTSEESAEISQELLTKTHLDQQQFYEALDKPLPSLSAIPEDKYIPVRAVLPSSEGGQEIVIAITKLSSGRILIKYPTTELQERLTANFPPDVIQIKDNKIVLPDES